MGRVLLEASGVSKKFCRRSDFALRYAAQDIWRELRRKPPRNNLRPGEFWALHDVDLHVESGEVLGVIGHNGAGKSTLINLAAGLLLPTEGKIELYTDRVALMDHQGGLSMIETGTENIASQLTLHGCPSSRLDGEIQAVSEFAEIGDFIHAPVGTYSQGMRIRLAFSIYTRMKPDLFIVDEALSGGDLQFRQKFQKYLREYINGGGSILFCSHELYMIQTLCRRCIMLESGRIVNSGDVVEVVHAYHEATRKAERLANSKNAAVSTSVATAPSILGAVSNGDGEALDRAEQDGQVRTQSANQWVLDESAGVIVESVEVRSPNGGAVLPGGAVEVEIKCIAAVDVANLFCAVEIGTGDVFPIATLTGGCPDAALSLKAGRSSMFCTIDCFTLAPGHYDLRMAITDAQTGAVLAWRGYCDPALHFEVSSLPEATSNLLQYRRNLIYLTTSWR